MKLNITSGGPADFGDGVFVSTRTKSITATRIGGDTLVVVSGNKAFPNKMLWAIVSWAIIVVGLTVMSAWGVPLSLPSPWNWFMWGTVGAQLVTGVLQLAGKWRLHSIEHKVVNAYGHGQPATADSLRAADYYHPACGSILGSNMVLLLIVLWRFLAVYPLLLVLAALLGATVLSMYGTRLPVLKTVYRAIQRCVCHDPTDDQYELGVVLLQKLYELDAETMNCGECGELVEAGKGGYVCDKCGHADAWGAMTSDNVQHSNHIFGAKPVVKEDAS